MTRHIRQHAWEAVYAVLANIPPRASDPLRPGHGNRPRLARGTTSRPRLRRARDAGRRDQARGGTQHLAATRPERDGRIPRVRQRAAVDAAAATGIEAKTAIPYEAVEAAYRALGLDPRRMQATREIRIRSSVVTVTRNRLSDSGNPLVAGQDALTEVLDFRVDHKACNGRCVGVALLDGTSHTYADPECPVHGKADAEAAHGQ